MKNLHKINGYPPEFSDMFIANLWFILTDNYGERKGSKYIKIDFTRKYTPYDPDNIYTYSPIYRSVYHNGWEQWMWEDWRKEEWILAGRPKIDISEIKIIR